MRFYAYPLNYNNSRTTPAVCGDNNYNTGDLVSTSVVCRIDTVGDGSGDPRFFSDIVVKGRGITDIAVTGAGGNNPNAFTGIGITPLTGDTGLDGLQVIQHHFGTPVNAKTITLTFTGTNRQIVDVMILNELLRIEGDNSYVARSWELDWIDSDTKHIGITGREVSIPAINNERDKFRLRATTLATHDNTARVNQIVNFRMSNKNFVFAPDKTHYPHLIAPCVWQDDGSSNRVGRNPASGQRYRLSIRES